MALSKQWARYPSEHSSFRSYTCVHISQHYLTLDMRQHQSLGVGRAPTVFGLELSNIASVSSIHFFLQSLTARSQSSHAFRSGRREHRYQRHTSFIIQRAINKLSLDPFTVAVANRSR